MGLRKLTDKTLPVDKAKPSAGEVSETTIRRYQAEAGRARTSDRSEATESLDLALSPRVGTDLQTPPPSHREFAEVDAEAAPDSSGTATPPAAPSQRESADPFVTALEALRSTLRKSNPPAQDHAAQGPCGSAAEALVPVEPHAAESDAIASLTAETEATSALERVPLPPSAELSFPADRSLYQESPARAERKSRAARKPDVARETQTIESGLQAVRNAVPGLNLTPPKSDTPVAGRKRPSSDGIPKSVSEDLPKYPARPRMRTCNRCGHETKLRDAKCHKCAHLDESLGILDAVIAGDLARVEQILLVRPHLITLRTSRHEWTLLHMAASGGNPKMAELLIEKGSSVNAANRDGKTPLHYAAGKGHVEIVRILLKHLADPGALYNGKSPLDLARKSGHREVEELLRQ